MRYFHCFVFICFFLQASFIPACAEDFKSISMTSLADKSHPWTITLKSNGQIEWKRSSDGNLLDSLFEEPTDTKKKTKTVSSVKTEKILNMVKKAGYFQPYDHAQEPLVKLTVIRTDGSRIVNNGPGDLAEDEDKRQFREIEAEMVKAAGFDYKTELDKSENLSSEPACISLLRSQVQETLKT